MAVYRIWVQLHIRYEELWHQRQRSKSTKMQVYRNPVWVKICAGGAGIDIDVQYIGDRYVASSQFVEL